MKLLRRTLDRDNRGEISLIPEEAEDMWHVYNLIVAGDLLTATTVRRVQKESDTGSVESDRKRIKVTLQVEGIDFNPGAETMRINGRNCRENPFIKLGAYHTIDLELNKKFTIEKDEWDKMAIRTVDSACNPATRADVAAVTMAEGLANICLITSSMSILVGRVEISIPRKRKASATQHDSALGKFFENTMQAILRHIDFAFVKCVILASPGFVKDKFFEYLSAQSVKKEYRVLMDNKAKFLLVHCSSAHKQSLKEVIADPIVAEKLADTKAANEVRVLNSFYDMLKNQPDRAFYGFNHCLSAANAQAIEDLLVTDQLFRACDVATRKRYIALCDQVTDSGGQVHVFSALHVSGEQLTQLSGVAAILRFPMPELEEDLVQDDDEDEDDEDNEDDDE